MSIKTLIATLSITLALTGCSQPTKDRIIVQTVVVVVTATTQGQTEAQGEAPAFTIGQLKWTKHPRFLEALLVAQVTYTNTTGDKATPYLSCEFVTTTGNIYQATPTIPNDLPRFYFQTIAAGATTEGWATMAHSGSDRTKGEPVKTTCTLNVNGIQTKKVIDELPKRAG